MNKLLDYNKFWEDTFGDIQQVGPTHKHLHRIYSEILKEIEYESIVDVGCGPGLNFQLLYKGKLIKELAGIDISNKCIQSIKEKYQGEFGVLDIQEACLERKYDLVFCSLLLEHVLNDDKAIENLFKMTGKYLLVTTIQGNYKRYERWEKTMGHIRNYNQGELEKKLIRNGFRIIKKIEWGFPFYSPIQRFLHNINPDMTVGKFGFIARIIATLFYWLGFFNSWKKGDIIIILAQV